MTNIGSSDDDERIAVDKAVITDRRRETQAAFDEWYQRVGFRYEEGHSVGAYAAFAATEDAVGIHRAQVVALEAQLATAKDDAALIVEKLIATYRPSATQAREALRQAAACIRAGGVFNV